MSKPHVKWSYGLLMWAWFAEATVYVMASEVHEAAAPVPWSASPLGRWVEMSVVIAVLAAVLGAIWKMMLAESKEKAAFIEQVQNTQTRKDLEQQEREKRMAQRIDFLDASYRDINNSYHEALSINTQAVKSLMESINTVMSNGKDVLEHTNNSMCLLLRSDVTDEERNAILSHHGYKLMRIKESK